MDLHPISLGIARPIPKRPGGSSVSKTGRSKVAPAHSDTKGDRLPPELKQKILKRDHYSCKCCGFISKKFQDVLFLDSNIKNRSERNLITTCIFCHQCFNLEKVSDMRSGVLIWLPEIEQHKLHHIARAIYVARISQGPLAEVARNCLDILMKRREEATERIGSDDPYILSTVLKDYLGYKHYHHRDKKLDGIRLFPLDRRIIKEADLEFNQFPQILAYWRSKDGPFGGKSPPQWISIYSEIAASA